MAQIYDETWNNVANVDSSGRLAVSLSGASIEITQTEIKSLIETLQELTSRLSVLSAFKGVNESLRVTPISSVSTAVTGPITSANSIAEKVVAGVGYTQRVATENISAVLGNINNCIGS